MYGPSSTPVSAARRVPAASSACTPTRHSRSRVRATSSATGSSPSCRRSGPTPAVLPSMTMDLELARQQWRDGNPPRRGCARRPAALPAAGRRCTDRVVDALRQRLGQSSRSTSSPARTTAQTTGCATLLEDADPDGAVPTEPGTVADAAFHAYARGATGLSPVKEAPGCRGRRGRRLRRGRGRRRGSARQPATRWDADPGQNPPAAAARTGRARNGDDYGAKPLKLARGFR